MKFILPTIVLTLLGVTLGGCAPAVGTEKWCEKIEDTPKGDWSANDATAYAKHCVFENYVDKND